MERYGFYPSRGNNPHLESSCVHCPSSKTRGGYSCLVLSDTGLDISYGVGALCDVLFFMRFRIHIQGNTLDSYAFVRRNFSL